MVTLSWMKSFESFICDAFSERANMFRLFIPRHATRGRQMKCRAREQLEEQASSKQTNTKLSKKRALPRAPHAPKNNRSNEHSDRAFNKLN